MICCSSEGGGLRPGKEAVFSASPTALSQLTQTPTVGGFGGCLPRSMHGHPNSLLWSPAQSAHWLHTFLRRWARCHECLQPPERPPHQVPPFNSRALPHPPSQITCLRALMVSGPLSLPEPSKSTLSVTSSCDGAASPECALSRSRHDMSLLRSPRRTRSALLPPLVWRVGLFVVSCGATWKCSEQPGRLCLGLGAPTPGPPTHTNAEQSGTTKSGARWHAEAFLASVARGKELAPHCLCTQNAHIRVDNANMSNVSAGVTQPFYLSLRWHFFPKAAKVT